MKIVHIEKLAKTQGRFLINRSVGKVRAKENFAYILKWMRMHAHFIAEI